MITCCRFQFSLRTLLSVVTLFVVALAVITTFGMELVAGFSGLVLSCIFVLLLALALVPFDSMGSRLPYWTSFAFTPVLYGGLNFAFFLFGEAIDQPHPEYSDGGSWLTHGVANICQSIPMLVAAMIVIVVVDAALQSSRPRDGAYFPRLVNLWRGLRLLRVRLLLIIGGLLVVGYYATTVIEVWSACQKPCGWVWPPKRVFAVCQFLWGLLWLADTASRPQRGTMIAAIGYLLCLMLLFPADGGVLRGIAVVTCPPSRNLCL